MIFVIGIAMRHAGCEACFWAMTFCDTCLKPFFTDMVHIPIVMGICPELAYAYIQTMDANLQSQVFTCFHTDVSLYFDIKKERLCQKVGGWHSDSVYVPSSDISRYPFSVTL